MNIRGMNRLARLLRSTHRKTKSWRTTSKVCKVFTQDGRVNPGLAKRIALEGYIPSDDVIERLIQHGAIEGKKKKIQQPKDLFEMATDTLRAALINRQTMPEIDPRMIAQFKKLGWIKRVGVR